MASRYLPIKFIQEDTSKEDLTQAERTRLHIIEYLFNLPIDFIIDLRKKKGVLKPLEHGHYTTADEQVWPEKADVGICEESEILPEIYKLFSIPKLHLCGKNRSSPTEPKEYLMSFMNFLLETLCHATYPDLDDEYEIEQFEGINWMHDEEGHCKQRHTEEFEDANQRHNEELLGDVDQVRYITLQKELTYLFTIFADLPFQFMENEQIKFLLKILEIVARCVGNLVFFCIFKNITPSEFDEFREDMNECIQKLIVIIKKHCINFPDNLPRCLPPRTSPIDSLFIVDFLLEDLENLNSSQFDGVDQVNILQEELKLSHSLLKEFYEVPQDVAADELKVSLIEIRDRAYEAEYLINSHVVGNLPVWYLNLRFPSIICKFKHANMRFQETCKMFCGIKAIRNFDTETSSQHVIAPNVVADIFVVGYEDNRTRFLSYLIGGSKKRGILSIFGMPGLGKTTITKKLYQDRSVQDHFDRRAWCVAAQSYTKRRALIEILLCLGTCLRKDEITELDDIKIGLKIHRSLVGRRYLIVIDDVWQSNTLDDLRRYFPDNGNGSRIMLTSRIQNIAQADSINHTLLLLSEVQSFELLKIKVFPNEHCPPQLLEIGKAIAANCRGLPLALVVTAGILANVGREESSWEKVKNQLDVLMLDDINGYRNILELSFEHLPNHLKLCFLYLVVFPKGTEINIDNLIRMWIAERLIQKRKDKELEYVAKKYISDLISRSLLVIARRGTDANIKTCAIHDLLRDMCVRKAHEENFMQSIKREEFSIFGKHKWLSAHCYTYISHLPESPFCFSKMPFLRVLDTETQKQTVVSRVTNSHALPFLEVELRRDIFPANLRYLVLCRMPKSVQGNFANLEFLHVKSKRRPKIHIPSMILKIMKLRYLRIEPFGKFEKDCDVSETNNLMYLSHVEICNEKDKEILQCSPRLRRLKCTLMNTDEEHMSTAKMRPNFIFFNELESLTIGFHGYRDKSLDISLPLTIKKLHFHGTMMPWKKMSTIGRLPNLHVLKIGFFAFMGDAWDTTEGEFLELRFLKLYDLDLKEWNTCSENFPRLESLVLSFCKNLQEISSDFGCHSTLQKIEVDRCNELLKESIALIKDEQLGNGNEEFEILMSSDSEGESGKEVYYWSGALSENDGITLSLSDLS